MVRFQVSSSRAASAQLKVPLKVVDLVAGRVGHDVAADLVDLLAGFGLLGDGDGFPQLPVRLSIQLVSTNKHASRFFR